MKSKLVRRKKGKRGLNLRKEDILMRPVEERCWEMEGKGEIGICEKDGGDAKERKRTRGQ